MVSSCFRPIARPVISEVATSLTVSARSNRTISKAYLATYSDGHEEAIAYQVTNGKNGMPAFGPKLSEADIADVAAYVESQSIKGWS